VPGGEAEKQARQGEAAHQQKTAGQMVAEAARSIASWLGSWLGGRSGKRSDDKQTGGMSEAETKQMSGSLDKLPTSAAGISTSPGPAPELAMKGEAKATSDARRAELETQTARLEQQGRADSRVPLGEDRIETSVPTEELVARPVPRGGGPAAVLPTLEGAAPSEEVGFVAKEQHGAEIDAALAKASADVTAERAKHTQEEAKARADADKQVRDLKTKADADHAAAKAKAKAESDKARGEWQAEIDKQGKDARKQADKKVAEGMAHVQAEEAKANTEAKQHIEEGQQKAEAEKQKGEREAEEAKQKGKSKSSGFFGWLSSKAKAFFDGIKKAISAAIDAARKAVKAVIDAAKKLAMAAIELARKAITAAIKVIGDALIAISEVLLAAFPGLKAKFQAAIRKAVDVATAAVNKIADGLKQAVQAALDLLGAALDKALGLLEKGLHAIVDAAGAVVQGAIKAAQAVVAALGTWAKLIKDVASGPGAWLRKLGAAIVDGIRNHLWAAFKTAVVEWFKSKVFELLGVGGIVLQLLLEGGLTREHIIQMALDALIVAIPAALIAILIEKLVSMIVPAAGALMAIIEGLQAAWGTISRIIAAFAAFMAFLLAVRSGGAGPLFAVALASAAVVLLDFVANWLLKKLASAARKVGAKLKGLAEKFKAKRRAKKAAKEHPGRQNGKPNQKPGDKGDDDRGKNRQEQKDKRNREILAKAQRELPAKISAVVSKGTRGVILRGRLAIWRAQYRLSSLKLVGSGERATIVAKVNPEATLLEILQLHREELLAYLREVAQQARLQSKSQADEALATHREEQTASGATINRYDFEHPINPHAVAEGVSAMPPLRRGKATNIHMGDGKARLTGGWGNRQSTQRVSEYDDGKLQSGGGKYADLAARYSGRGAKLADAIRIFQRSGKVTSGFNKDELTLWSVLIGGVEPGTRSSAAGVHGQMMLDLMEAGAPMEDLLGRDKKGGLYPMSPGGAVADAKKADEFLDPNRTRQPGERASAAADRHMEREIQLIHAWVSTLDLVFDSKATERQKIDEIKQQIRTRILGPTAS
jgi:hypothetical protein